MKRRIPASEQLEDKRPGWWWVDLKPFDVAFPPPRMARPGPAPSGHGRRFGPTDGLERAALRNRTPAPRIVSARRNLPCEPS